MATEAARLKPKNPLGGKRKTDLTLTGLLMEGLGRRKTTGQAYAIDSFATNESGELFFADSIGHEG